MWTVPAIAALIGIFLGLLLLVSGLGTVFHPRTRVQALREFAQSAALRYLGGVMAFLLGAAIVTMVPLSDDLFSIAVAVLGWAAMVKGVLLLLWDDGLVRVAHRMNAASMAILGWAGSFVGLLLFVMAVQTLRSETGAAQADAAPAAAQLPPAAPEQ